MVVSSGGTVAEVNHYYPFGSLFANTSVQPYKYNGKELDTKKGLNWYDYGARHYDATLGRWFTVDPLGEKYYSWSSYNYCLNNSISAVDFEGKLVIFINGMHIGDGGTIDYWNKNGGGFADGVMKHLKDNHAMFIDGSFGGAKRLPINLDSDVRHYMGWLQGRANIDNIISAITNSQGELKETIKVITHSMGSAFAKGFIEALINGLLEHDIPLYAIEFEADFAPFQPSKQKAVKDVRLLQFTNRHDKVANNKLLMSPFAVIEGSSEAFIEDNVNKGHSIKDFYNQIINLPTGNYKIVNGVIVPQD